jgi:flagellar biosynthesis protein FlhG
MSAVRIARIPLPTTQDSRLTTPWIAIMSGKGGVGKTFLAVNLAIAMQGMGLRCLLVDLDWGLANVDVALGLAPPRHIGHVIGGECGMGEACVQAHGVTILPNGCGDAALARLDAERSAELLRAIRRDARTSEGDAFDLVIADTHPGIGAFAGEIARVSQRTVVVTTPEPTSLTDTYALLKVLSMSGHDGSTGLVVNQARSPADAEAAVRRLDLVARRFLGCGVTSWGHVSHDAAVPRAVAAQQPLLLTSPRSAAAQAVRELAARLLEGPALRADRLADALTGDIR